MLLSELTTDPQVIQRFKSELLLASRISHRNILRIHDLSEADGVKFITMAYVVEGRVQRHVAIGAKARRIPDFHGCRKGISC